MAKYKTAVAINLSVFLLMVGVGLIVALLPQRMMQLSTSVSQVGWLATAYAVPAILLQLPVGRLADRLGCKPFLVAGYLLCGLTGLVYFFADRPSLYFGGRFLQGIAEVPIWALAPVLLSIRYAADKGRQMGLYNASLHCGLTTGGLLSIFLFRLWPGNEPFLLFGLLSFLGGLITILFVEDFGKAVVGVCPSTAQKGLKTILADRANRILFCGIALYGAGYGIFLTLVPAFLIHSRAATSTLIGFFFSSFYIALSVSQLFAGGWSDRNGRRPMMIAGTFLAAIGITIFPWCPSPWMILPLGLASTGLGMFCVSSMAFLNERAACTEKGSASGAYFFFWGLGFFVGPLLMGQTGNWVGYPLGFVLFAALWAGEAFAIHRGMPEGSPKETAVIVHKEAI